MENYCQARGHLEPDRSVKKTRGGDRLTLEMRKRTENGKPTSNDDATDVR